MTAYGPGNPPPEDDAARLQLDVLLFGQAFTLDGIRVPPEGVVLHQAATVHVTHADADECARIFNLGFAEAVEQYTGAGSIHTQEEFLTALDELLDHTLHAEGCYIDPNDTTCVCVIGAVRAVLPPCMVKQPPPSGEGDLWSCTRSVHPASPDRHVWANR